MGDGLVRREYREPTSVEGIVPFLSDMSIPESVPGGLCWCLVSVLIFSVSSSGVSSSGILSSMISVDASEMVASLSSSPVAGTELV